MDRYGLIGFPLKHSFSRRFFSEKFAEENIQAEYLNFEIPQISLFSNILDSNPTLRGLNVTIPYKEEVIPFLHRLDADAQVIGAVNVIKINTASGKLELIGYNTDIIGFQNSIAPLVDSSVHKKALVLGTGGASKAVAQGLKNLGIVSILVSRRPSEGQFTYEDLNRDILSEYTVIVNTSPVGTFPDVDECPDIPYRYLTSSNLLYDLVYNPAQTTFLKKGAEHGAIVKNGAEMLELQALAAWDIWNGRTSNRMKIE